MLRSRESWKDVVINWIIMLLIICPLFAVSAMYGLAGILWVLGYQPI